MKICDLTQFYSPVSGGVKRYVQEKIRFIREHTQRDEHVLIIPGARDDCIVDSRDSARAKTYTVRSPLISHASQYRAFLRLAAIAEIFEKEKPDVIECGDPYQVAWKTLSCAEAARPRKIPAVAFYHSHFAAAYLPRFLHGMARFYTRELYNRFARTLVPSPALGALLRDWGVQNVECIDLGVNTQLFNPDQNDRQKTRDELGIPRERILLIYVGRLAPEKNTRTLCEAFEILHREHADKNFHFLIAGEGQQRAPVEKLQERARDATTWISRYTEPENLARLYRAADLFVHPGVQETFGLVALEAQASGVPIVGIRGSYMDRIIHCDQTFWARENSAAALAQAIVEMSAQDLKKMGETASREVRERYSWEQVFARLFGIYREVVSR